MADDDFDDNDGDGDLTEGLERKRLSGKKIVIFAVPVLLLVLGAAGFFVFSGGEDESAESEGQKQEKIATVEETKVIFYDLPEMVVNLNTGGRKATYLKIKVSLEVDRESARADLEEKLPRIVDNFQVYLRELRLEDLNGSAGMYRLKEELLLRVNQSVEPTQVKDVLFAEMLVQ